VYNRDALTRCGRNQSPQKQHRQWPHGTTAQSRTERCPHSDLLKSGVGKTTSAGNIGALFAARGLPGLLVDIDPQCALDAAAG
jgi:hypothetical protein